MVHPSGSKVLNPLLQVMYSIGSHNRPFGSKCPCEYVQFWGRGRPCNVYAHKIEKLSVVDGDRDVLDSLDQYAREFPNQAELVRTSLNEITENTLMNTKAPAVAEAPASAAMDDTGGNIPIPPFQTTSGEEPAMDV